MPQLFKECIELLEDLHRDVNEAIEGLPQAALDWKPAPDMNSLCVLVTHLTAAERYWIGDVMMNDPSGRVRDDEFTTTGLDQAALTARLEESLAYVRRALECLSISDLERWYVSSDHSQEVSASWAFLHTLIHSASHLGHIQITRQLWDQRDAAP